jgi:SAM-dependent methyltransferase
MSGEHVFREAGDGGLEFVGDFEGLYRAEDDPWGQSGTESRMGAYYRASRRRLTGTLRRHQEAIGGRPLLEVGCGLGFVTRLLADEFPGHAVEGLDISGTAIAKARTRFPGLAFHVGDIAGGLKGHGGPEGGYGAVILNNLLWYILPRLDDALANARTLAGRGGIVVVGNAFVAGTQRYGADLVDGFPGLLRVLLDEGGLGLRLVEASYDDSPALEHHDGIVVLRRLD